jgi:hypothetical protein
MNYQAARVAPEKTAFSGPSCRFGSLPEALEKAQMAEIKAIETVYNGYRFRSRLEARWAVFFDAANIPYEYETEGFEVAGIKYLPDFFLKDIGIYAEVKPNLELSRKDLEKIVKFAVDGEKKLLLIVGAPWEHEMFLIDRRTCDGWESFEPMESYDTHETQLDSYLEQLHDWSGVIFAEVPFQSGIRLAYRLMNPYLSHHLHGAGLEAKQARFEHGRRGS